MLGILAAVCALQTQGRAIDGETAVARAQRLMRSVGFLEKFTLHSLNEHHYISKEPCWSVGLTSKRGPMTVVLDARTGRILLMQGGEDPAIPYASNRPPTPENTRRAWKLLHLLGYNDSVTLAARAGYTNGPIGAIFYRTLHGLTFFNLNPTYGHRLVMEPKTGAINYFQPSPPLPEVNGWNPEISGPVARKKISLWVERRLQEQHRPKIDTGQTEKPELGYWKFRGETTARLVWQVAGYINMNGVRYGGGAYRIFVDAMTGDLIEPDDALIGANP